MTAALVPGAAYVSTQAPAGYVLLETLTVPLGTGAPPYVPSPVVSATVLLSGITYRIRASGHGRTNYPPCPNSDAEFDVIDALGGQSDGCEADDPTSLGADTGLGINLAAPGTLIKTLWIPSEEGAGYNPAHIYTIPFAGLGAPITLQYNDCYPTPYNCYDNNSGALRVEIFGPAALLAGALSGTVYEDVNYGGGPGRTLAASSGTGRPGAVVELYQGDTLLTSTTTDAAGAYTFGGLLVETSYTVRVVNETVTSSRPGSTPGLLAVQTHRVEVAAGAMVPVANEVGGAVPASADSGAKSPGGILSDSAVEQSVTTVVIPQDAPDVAGIDFGFNFDTIVNRNDTGQGSLRQFLINSNALGNAGLAQAGSSLTPSGALTPIPAETETSLFMVPAALLDVDGVATVEVLTALPEIVDASTAVDATTQTVNIGDTNPGVLGADTVVGVDRVPLHAIPRPEVELLDGGDVAYGLSVRADSVTVRGVAIWGFGSSSFGDLYVGALPAGGHTTGVLITSNVFGVPAAKPPTATASAHSLRNVSLSASDQGSIEENLLGLSVQQGIWVNDNCATWIVRGNLIRGDPVTGASADGLDLAHGGGFLIEANLVAFNRANGIDLVDARTSNTVRSNTIRNNGQAGGSETAGIGVRSSGNTIARNIIASNYGPGVLVADGRTANLITQNSMFDNGSVATLDGDPPSGEIGIDLLAAAGAPANTGLNGGPPPFQTVNDVGDVDTGGNSLRNFPVLTHAITNGNALVVAGFVRPGSIIELFEAAPDATGFGEGRTFLATLVEGSADDLDSSTGSYAGPINGIDQGADTTNRFRFIVTLGASAGAIGVGTSLTATATVDGATSEFSGVVTVAVTADLGISATAPPTLQPGGTIAVETTVSNAGPGSAADVIVVAPTPPGLTFVSNSGDCTSPFPCSLGALAAGAARAIVSIYTIPPSYLAPSPVVRTAGVSSPTFDGALGNNSVSVSVALASADLSLSQDSSVIIDGNRVTFAMVVRNNGPQPALEATVVDATPAGVAFVETSADCLTAFPCALGALPPGAVRTIRATYEILPGLTGAISNTAAISSTTADPVTSNNSATASTLPTADLSVIDTGPETAFPGAPITYTLVIGNAGPITVPVVRVDAPTPPGLQLVAVSGSCTTTLPCTFGPLGGGASATIAIHYTVSSDVAGTEIVSTAMVSSSFPDPLLANNTSSFTTRITTPTDPDGDGMPTAWEVCVGLDPAHDDADEDPDGDGRTNLVEYGDRTHPRGFVQRYLPEGASNSFFHTRIGVLNLDPGSTAHVLARFQREGAAEESGCFRLDPLQGTILGGETQSAAIQLANTGGPFATLIEADVAIATERTMSWEGGGEHADSAVDATATTWYFAEGTTTDGFRIYYLLQNPGFDPAVVEMTFLRPAPLSPIVLSYTIAPRSRLTIWANEITDLAGMDLGAIVRVIGPGAIAAARSIYRDVDGQLLRAGTSASGTATPHAEWFFAEGATGAFFQTYLLLLNPSATDAELAVTFLMAVGPPVTRPLTVRAGTRATLLVNDLDPALADVSTAVRVTTTNGVPIVVERSMWWPSTPATGSLWYEGHTQAGIPTPGPRWAFVPATLSADTQIYLLVANYSSAAGRMLITLTYDDGGRSSRIVDIGGLARTTIEIGAFVPEAAGRSFTLNVDALGAALPLIVERAVYRTANGVTWSSGSVTVGTRVP